MSDLEDWIARQYPRSVAGLFGSISRSDITKNRPHFRQTVTPRKGSVVASPVLAAYDPDPDYFFHWYRDAAIVMDALRIVYRDGALGSKALAHFIDFVDFSLSLMNLDGLTRLPLRAQPGFEKFLRRDIASVRGDAIFAEARVNPDGTLDVSDWPRPQHDGPALRALTIMRWLRDMSLDPDLCTRALRLLRADLDFVLLHARQPCFDIWEEEKGLHYYTLRVCAAALAQGARWLSPDERDRVRDYDAEADAILCLLDTYWRTDGHVGSRPPVADVYSPKDRDISAILAVLHTADTGAHSVHDPRLQATLTTLEALFDAEYAINHARPPGHAPAMGRYPGDRYYSGGAYYFATLGAAEFCFRAGQREHGDAFLQTVRAFTPDSGALAEQFDQHTGNPASARDLAWSHAAFISCIAVRTDGDTWRQA